MIAMLKMLHKGLFVFVLVTCGFHIHNLPLVTSEAFHDFKETVNEHLSSDFLQLVGDDLEPGNTYIKGYTPKIATEAKAEDVYSYVAAVLEYAPNTDVDGELETIVSNAQSYIVFAEEAKIMGADIVVFPEYGLTGTDLPVLPADMLPYTQAVPDPAEALAPCDFHPSNTSVQALRLLSCAARDLQMYMVVDLTEQVACEECLTGHYFYNTQVVLDRHGTVIARYRKINLFAEDNFRPGPLEPETAIFTTDFGVNFSLQICFDILYEYPGVANVVERGIKHVAMSTAWMDQLPSLTAPGMQSAWAVSLGINLMVANIHNPAQGFTGSGIYHGDSGQEHHYTYDSQGSNLVIMTINSNNSEPDTIKHIYPGASGLEHRCTYDGEGSNPVNMTITHNDSEHDTNRGPLNLKIDSQEYEHKFKYENLSKYSHFSLNQTGEGEFLTQRLCHNEEFCCIVNYTWSERESNITYMLLAFDGLQSHVGGRYKTYYQVCSVLHCSSDNVLTCAHVDSLIPQSNSLRVQSLEGVFETPYVYPSVLNQNLTLAKRNVWSFDNTQINTSRWKVACHVDQVDELHQLLALTLFGRIYDRDL